MIGRRLRRRATIGVRRWALAFAVGAVGAGFAPAAAAVDLPDTLEQRLAACAACHGAQGEGLRRSEYYPRIAGKPAAYLYRQLVAFRDGRRTSPTMAYYVRYLSDAYLREIAAHYAARHPSYPPPVRPPATKEVLARGEALVRRGDPALKVPACADCHGSALTGVEPGVPGLVGLFPDYINAQMGAWRGGLRHADAPDCMATIASRLAGTDVVAITAYLARQPASPTAPPVPAAKAPLPLDCGSQPAGAVAATGTPNATTSATTTATTTAATTGSGAAEAKATAPNTIPVAPTSAAADRGEYLARAGDCAACHTARGGAPFAGGLALPTPFGTLYTPNITPDAATGIGRWTADEFWTALHDGRGRDGAPLYPAFPYASYTKVTRADADAIHAYLMRLAPVRQPNRAHALRFPYDQRALLNAWRALYFKPGTFVPDPAQSAEWNRGAYLVQGLGHCDECHTRRNALGGTDPDRALAGGLMPQQDWFAPALTRDRVTGLGAWTQDDVVALLRTGVSRQGVVFGPMAQVVHDSLQHLTGADARAIAVYLATLPATAAPPPAVASAAERNEAGARLYADRCKACHGADGGGAPPHVPPLARQAAIEPAGAVNTIRIVLFGGFPPSTAGNPRPYGMPPFAWTLDDAQVADVVNHVRQSFGRRGAAVSAGDVAKLRSIPAD